MKSTIHSLWNHAPSNTCHARTHHQQHRNLLVSAYETSCCRSSAKRYTSCATHTKECASDHKYPIVTLLSRKRFIISLNDTTTSADTVVTRVSWLSRATFYFLIWISNQKGSILFTLFSKFFSIFLHSTCLLSVFHLIFRISRSLPALLSISFKILDS